MSDLQNDIIKYKRGELGPKEMHALEKKALSDPFLAEALEGLENISSNELLNDVEELNRKILKEKKTILFTPLRIAAGVILVAAAVFLFYELAPKRETLALKTEKQSAPATPSPKTEEEKPKDKAKAKDDVATKSNLGAGENSKNEPRKPRERANAKNNVATKSKPGADENLKTGKKIESSSKIEKEKLDAEGNQALAENAKPKIETQPTIAEHKETAGPEKKAEDAKVETQKEAPVALAMEPVQQVTGQQDLKNESRALARAKKSKSEAMSGAGLAGKAQTNPKAISGKVISAEDGAPLPGVNVVVEGTTQGTVTDVNGNFSLQASGENQRLVFSFIGLQTQEINIEGKDKVDVELKQDASQLSEVVVSGFGVKQDDDAKPIIHLANPVGGMRAYNKYLDSNVRYPEQAIKNNVKGKVKIEFSVRTDGSLDDYKVVKSLSYGCDEEVIRLIKEGPKWSPSTENGQPIESTVLVGVKFDPAKSGR